MVHCIQIRQLTATCHFCSMRIRHSHMCAHTHTILKVKILRSTTGLAHTFNFSTLRQRQVHFLSSKTAWSTEQVQDSQCCTELPYLKNSKQMSKQTIFNNLGFSGFMSSASLPAGTLLPTVVCTPSCQSAIAGGV